MYLFSNAVKISSSNLLSVIVFCNSKYEIGSAEEKIKASTIFCFKPKLISLLFLFKFSINHQIICQILL